MSYEDILYEIKEGIATVTINRPKVYNAFRPKTIEELTDAFTIGGDDPEVGVIVLTGAGEKAFCTGGDMGEWHVGEGYTGASWTGIGLSMERLHRMIRSVPKPVIASVNGYAIGGGNVLQVLCDLAIAPKRPSLARLARRSEVSTPASVRPTWRGSWARGRPARSGCSAGATRPRRHSKWG